MGNRMVLVPCVMVWSCYDRLGWCRGREDAAEDRGHVVKWRVRMGESDVGVAERVESGVFFGRRYFGL